MSKTDHPISFKLEVTVRNQLLLKKLVKNLVEDGTSNFSWTCRNADEFTLTVESSWTANLREFAKLIPKEEGWE